MKIVGSEIGLGASTLAWATLVTDGIGRLTNAYSLFTWLPKKAQDFLVSNLALNIAAVAVVFFALRVVLHATRGASDARKNEKHTREALQANLAEFGQFKDTYQTRFEAMEARHATLEGQMADLIAAVHAMAGKLDLFETARERTVAEIKTGNDATIQTAVNEAVNLLREEMRDRRLVIADELRREIQGPLSEMQTIAGELLRNMEQNARQFAAEEAERIINERAT